VAQVGGCQTLGVRAADDNFPSQLDYSLATTIFMVSCRAKIRVMLD
jgi:hypothetical protein